MLHLPQLSLRHGDVLASVFRLINPVKQRFAQSRDETMPLLMPTLGLLTTFKKNE